MNRGINGGLMRRAAGSTWRWWG